MGKSGWWEGFRKWGMATPAGAWLQTAPPGMPPMPAIPEPGACCGCGCFVVLGLIALLLGLLVLPFAIWVARDSKRRGLENRRLWIWLVLLSGPVGWLIYRLQRFD